MRELEIVTHKLFKNATLVLITAVLLLGGIVGCKKKVETAKPKGDFRTPGSPLPSVSNPAEASVAKEENVVAGKPEADRSKFGTSVSDDSGKAGSSEPTGTTSNQAIRIQINVSPRDATLTFNGTVVPPSPDSSYLFDSITSPASVEIEKTGYLSFARELDPVNGNTQMVIALSPNPQWWLDHARRQFEKGEVLAALQSVGVVETIQPVEIATNRLKLKIFLRLGRPELAEQQITLINAAGESLVGFEKEEIQLNLLFAQASIKNNNPQMVLGHLTRAIDLGCNDPWAFQQRGLVNFELRRFDQAINDFQNVTAIDASLSQILQPKMVSALIQRARIRQNGNEIANMLDDLGSVLKFEPDNLEALLMRSKAMNEDGRFDLAATDSRRILATSPKEMTARLELGFALAGQKRFEEAIDEFNYVLQANNDHPIGLKNRGFCLFKIQRIPEALKDLERSIEIDPGNSETYFLQGMSLLKSNQPKKALASFKRSLELTQEMALTPDADLYYYMATTLEELGETEKALEEYTRAISVDSGNIAARLNRCILLTNRGSVDLAISDASFVLSITPDHAIALNSRAAAFVLQNESEKAMADFDAAIESAPNYAEAWFNRGNLHFQLQQYSKAIADFSEAAKQDPDTPAFYLGRAKSLIQLGEFEKASSDLKLVLKQDFKNKEAIDLMKIIPK